jgi:hypothetical protein
VFGCVLCTRWRGECPIHVEQRAARTAIARRAPVLHLPDLALVPVPRARRVRTRQRIVDERQAALDFGTFDPRQRVLTFT